MLRFDVEKVINGMDKTPPDKTDFSQFRYEKPSSEWQNEYDYIPFLAKKIITG